MTYTTAQLKEILAEHVEWAADNSKGQRANLSSANLRGANLRDADLRGADLRGADLSGANLWDANLRDANLRDANLRGANLRGANLRGVTLSGADLRGANLKGVTLSGADLRGANLSGATLDFSSGIPLWCGGTRFQCDAKLIQQVLAHLCTLDCKNTEWIALRKAIRPFAEKSRRASDLGLV